MNNEIISFIITFISGLSTLLGFFIIFFKKEPSKLLSSALYFAAGVMISVSFFDLLPHSYKYISNYYFSVFTILLMILFIILGIILSNLIANTILKKSNDNIYRLGLMTMIVIIIHNVPEGIITYLTTNSDIELGISLATAISIHNIPEGISVAVPIYYATKSKLKAFGYTLLSSLSEPIGAIIAYLFLENCITNYYLGILFSLIAGIMINISISELLPNAFKHKYKYNKIFFILGVLIMILTLLG